jgi:hypothetical protein
MCSAAIVHAFKTLQWATISVFGNSPSVRKTNRIQIAPTCEHLLSFALQKIILECRADKFELLGHSGMSLRA